LFPLVQEVEEFVKKHGSYTGWPLSRHWEIPWQFPDNVLHSCPC